MNLLETLRLAVRALARSPMRSFLTALGIIIGVAAVISMVAIGEGAKASVEKAFSAMGSNLLIVLPGTTTSGGVMGGFGSMPTLTWDDLQAIQTELPAVKRAAPALRSNVQLAALEQNWLTSLYGTTPDYFELRNWPIAKGETLSEADIESGAKVIVLGETVANRLYGANADVIGQSLRIRNIPFRVVGVLAKKGQSATGQDYDDAAFVPVSTYQAKIARGLGKFLSGTIFVEAQSQSETQRAQNQVTGLLRDRHRLGPNVDDDFSIRNLSELASAQQEGTRTMTLLLASIAAVSLVVGGIGIMNIMLVSVTERTREIGLRMAIGAKSRDILTQFLIEAATLSLAGGLCGILFGLLIANRLAASFGWPMLLRPDIIVISAVFSAVVGVAFGLYPARKAAMLDPIEALRYE